MNTKLHAICDSTGRPLNFFVTACQVSDYIGARALFASLPKVDWLLGDRGYDADWFREALKDKGIRACKIIKPTVRDAQNTIELGDRIMSHLGNDESTLRVYVFAALEAKKAEAFSRISFSNFKRLFSLRKRSNSAASACCRRIAAINPAASISDRYVFSCELVTPNSFATPLCVAPGS